MYSWMRSVLFLCFIYSMNIMAEQPSSSPPEGKVARALFTSAIENREPVDQLVIVTSANPEVYFFTDLRHLEGRVITHRWEYDGRIVSQFPFKVDGPRWRSFSKLTIKPEQTGEWSVTVIDQSGWPLHTELFVFQSTDAAVE